MKSWRIPTYLPEKREDGTASRKSQATFFRRGGEPRAASEARVPGSPAAGTKLWKDAHGPRLQHEDGSGGASLDIARPATGCCPPRQAILTKRKSRRAEKWPCRCTAATKSQYAGECGILLLRCNQRGMESFLGQPAYWPFIFWMTAAFQQQVRG
jgi:hypothetical protein